MTTRSSHRPLLFDLDGTLVDSRLDLAEAVNALLAEVGLRPLPLATVISFVGRGARTLVGRALDAADPAGRVPRGEETTRRFLGHYEQRLLPHTRAYPGVSEGLTALTLASVPMAVVTNKPEDPARRILEGLGLARHFAVILGGDSLPARKPEPGMLEAATRSLGVALAEAVMVGDSDVDAEAAERAGCPFLWVSWGGFVQQRPAGVTHVADRFEDVVELGLGGGLPFRPAGS